MNYPILAPFLPTLLIVVAVSAVVAAVRWLNSWQREEMHALLKSERNAMFAQFGAEISAERDETRRMIEAAISAHARDESGKFDSMSSRVTELLVRVEMAVGDAKRVAFQVSDQYQDMRRRIDRVEEEVKALRERPG